MSAQSPTGMASSARQHSQLFQGGRVPFPPFTGERVYMREFTQADGLPPELSRWQETVDAMLEGIDAPGSIFLMIDQSPVRALTTQRRPGLHVDGSWNPAIYAHGHGDGDEPVRDRGPCHPHTREEILLLASDALGSAGYVGAFDGRPGSGGDCSHIETDSLVKVDMEPGRVWAGPTLSMLHEALPVSRDCLRTVVRLNVRNALLTARR